MDSCRFMNMHGDTCRFMMIHDCDVRADVSTIYGSILLNSVLLNGSNFPLSFPHQYKFFVALFLFARKIEVWRKKRAGMFQEAQRTLQSVRFRPWTDLKHKIKILIEERDFDQKYAKNNKKWAKMVKFGRKCWKFAFFENMIFAIF